MPNLNLVPAELSTWLEERRADLHRARVVAIDSAFAFAGQEFFPDLRQGVPEDAQVEIAGQPSTGVAEPAPETVVEVFPMMDDAFITCQLDHAPSSSPLSLPRALPRGLGSWVLGSLHLGEGCVGGPFEPEIQQKCS